MGCCNELDIDLTSNCKVAQIRVFQRMRNEVNAENAVLDRIDC